MDNYHFEPINNHWGIHVAHLSYRKKDGHPKSYVVSQSLKMFMGGDIQSEVAKYYLDNFPHHLDKGARLYITNNRRSFTKAKLLFDVLKINEDTNGNLWKFYSNLNTKWCSCLMKPEARETKNWLLDVDNPDNLDKVYFYCEDNGIKMSETRKTKNGFHIICEKFDSKRLASDLFTIHKDGMLLIGWKND